MAENTLKMVPVADLKPSKTNPRKHFDPAALRELADSIAGVGLLQPIVGRQNGDGIEIVCGERRWRAAAMAKVERVPVIVRELSNEQVLRVQLVENKQRADTTPLEEARGYRQLMAFDAKKYTAASIGAMIGVSEKYVWDRMKLTDLIPPAQELLDQGRIGAAHGILLARLTPAQQQRVIDPDDGGLFEPTDADPSEPSLNLGEAPGGGPRDKAALVETLAPKKSRLDEYKARSVRELDAWIADKIRFDPAHAAAAAPLLFAGTKAAIDAALAKPGRRKKVVQITFDHLAGDAVRHDGGERVFGRQSWKEAKTECPSTALGVVAAGTRAYGRTLPVCVDRDCGVHWKAEIAERNRNRKARARDGGGATGPGGSQHPANVEAVAARDAQLRREREKREAFEKMAPALMKAVVASVKKAAMKTVLPRAERYLEQALDLGDAYAHLGMKKCAGAEDLARLLVMADVVEGTEYGAADLAGFCKAVGPFGGGIPAVVKELQARAAAEKKTK